MKLTLLLLLLSIGFLTNAQKLKDNKQYGYTYQVYKLDSTQSRVLYQQQKVTDTVDLFTNLFSTQYSDSSFNKTKLPKGHYLIARAKNTVIEYETYESRYFNIRSYGYNKEAWIFISDTKGSIIKDATLQLKGENYSYKEDCNCYPIPALKGNGWAKITHKDQFTYITVDGFKPPKEQFKNKKNKFKNKTFSNYRILPGYIAFNQPKYHLEDTVKTKAFLVKENGKPWKKKVKFNVIDRYQQNSIAYSTTLEPVTEGAYVHNFPIPDTFDIDRDYTIEYRNKRNKLLKSKPFRIEDFVLGNTTYKAELEKSTFYQGENLALLLEGTDANGLPLLDATAKVKIRLNNIQRHHRDSLFIPNSWYTSIYEKEVLLDVSGQTRLEFSDTLFPLSNSTYHMEVVMNNSENEPKKFNFTFHYKGETEHYTLRLIGDSIQAMYKYLGKSSSDCGGTLHSYFNGIELASQKVELPFTTKLDYSADSYVLKDQNGRTVANINTPSRINQLIYPVGKRSHDSIQISLHNEIDLPVSWQIFKGTKKVKGGRSSSINYKSLDETLDSYYIIYSFDWQGKDFVREKSFHIKEKKLNVKVDQPETVFPGASVPISVTVTDYKKNAKKDVNLTAWSVNMKFDEIPNPDLPYFGLNHYELLRPFNVKHSIPSVRTSEAIAQKHIDRMNLYNTPFYRFIYAKNGVGKETDSINSPWSEITPFVYKNGHLQKIFAVYINEEPAYISQSQKSQPNSILRTPGTYNLKIRTRTEMYDIKNVKLDSMLQTFICLNPDSAMTNSNVEYIKLDTIPFMVAEKEYLKSSMLVVNPTRYADIYFEQDSNVIRVKSGNGTKIYDEDFGAYSYYGPFKKGKINVTDVTNDTAYSFYFEPGYLYSFGKDTSYVSQPIVYPNPFKHYQASYDNPYWNYHERSTRAPKVNLPKEDPKKIVDNKRQKERNRKARKHPLLKTRYHKGNYSRDNVSLSIANKTKKTIVWQGLFNFENDSCTNIRYGYSNNFSNIKAGRYTLFMLFNDSSYIEIPNFKTLPNGKNSYRFDPSYLRPYDQEVLSKYEQEIIRLNKPELRKFRNPPTEIKGFTSKILKSKNNKTMMSGYLLNHKGEPIDYATIYAEIQGYFKGGALTNQEGYFEIPKLPAGNYMLKIRMNSDHNYTMYNIRVPKGKNTQLWIEPQILFNYYNEVYADYEEVEVMYDANGASESYSTPMMLNSMSSNMSVMSVSSAKGIFKISGKEINKVPSLMGEADIQTSLQLLPGVVNSGKDKKFGKGSIEGERLNTNSNRIRSTFRNYGFWNPNLVTDKNGQAHFTVQYPDNITQWKTIVPAMDGNKNTGIGFSQTKAFKPLSANLGLPTFLVQNDTSFITGKVLNYTEDSVSMSTYFDINGVKANSKNINVFNYNVEKFSLNIDSIGLSKVTFGLDKGDGYIDGERRDINVRINGVKRSTASLLSLNNDTTITILPNSELSGRTIYITNDPFDLIKKELENLKAYKYGCNEQTASKIKALLLEKKFLSNLNEPFKGEKELAKHIKTLEKNQNKNGSWGWWDVSEGDQWISGYVTETMNLVVASGYRTKAHMKGAAYLKSLLPKMNISNKLEALNILASIPYPMDYQVELDKLKGLNLSRQDQFQYFKLLQSQGKSIDVKEITESFEKGKEGIFWGEQLFSVKVNQLQTSLLAYQILKKAGGQEKLLKETRTYFLNYKSDSKNTIEQANMLQNFLEDMLMESNLEAALIPKLSINNSEAGDQYPMEFKFDGKDSITLTKQGAPIKMYTYEHKIELAPVCSDSVFKISTKFVQNNKEVQHLTAGKPVTMEVEVIVRKASKYVLLEVPIPASCVYGGAVTVRNYNEEYRKQYFDKTSIACRYLKPGRHTFTIQLIPRFEGSYSLLPASAQLMYFPDVCNFTAGKRIIVK